MTRIALVQQRAGADKGANVARGVKALEAAAAKGAEVVCFSELAFEPFYPQCKAQAEYEHLAESVPGPTTDIFVALARQLGVVVVLNLFECDGERCYDTSPVIDADGTLLGVTRMVHITDYPNFHEQDYYAPGDTGAPVYRTRAGRVGVAICYDRHFPEYMRMLALGGAQLVLVPQAGTIGEWPADLFEAEMRVTAFQNGYVIGLCNRVGADGSLTFAGESFVCTPDGAVLARAPQGEEHLLVVDIDLNSAGRSHARRLFLQHRRPELYVRWFGLEQRPGDATL
jgi:N-carbamoylputrescine amidase